MRYGYKHLGIFYKEFLIVGRNGFIYKGRRYGWSDITEIRRYDTAFWSFVFHTVAPVSYVFLKDGSRIRLYGACLLKNGDGGSKDFFRNTSAAYEELVAFLEKKVASVRRIGH